MFDKSNKIVDFYARLVYNGNITKLLIKLKKKGKVIWKINLAVHSAVI